MNNKLYTRILMGSIREILKPHGFTVRGNTFYASSQDVVVMIQLQKSVYSTADIIEATVNLAVYSLTLTEKLGYRWRQPSVIDAHWRERLGFLSPERDDIWWTVSSEEQAREAGADIACRLNCYGLPALFALSSTAKLHELWRSDGRHGLTDYERREYLELLAGEA